TGSRPSPFPYTTLFRSTVSALVTSASMVLSSMGSTGLPIALSTMLMRASARQMVRTMVPVEMFSLSIDFQSSLAQRLNFAQRYNAVLESVLYLWVFVDFFTSSGLDRRA